MFDIQCKGIVTVYSDMCLRYRVIEMLLCSVIFSKVHGGGSVTAYSDVCLKYRVREMLLCTVM